MSTPKKEPNAAWLNAIALILAAVIGAAALFMTKSPSPPPDPSPTLPAPPKPNPAPSAEISMFCGRSALKWITSVAGDFEKGNDAKIALSPIGSYEGFRNILDQKQPLPVVWNPGEGYWVTKLAKDWGEHHQTEVIGTPQDILRTHYVIVMWEDRARIFEQAMKLPQYRGRTWQLLYTLATEGWRKIGGNPDWGYLKFIHSNPMKSSTGLFTLGLMLAEYRQNGHPGATTNDNGYTNFMETIESRLVFPLKDTTTKSVEQFTESRKEYQDGDAAGADMAVAYEQNALQLLKDGQRIRMIYPEPVLSLTYQAVVLKGNWVSDKQAQVGEKFIEYLRTREVQAKAVDSGFYPAFDGLREEENQKLDTSTNAQAGFLLRPDEAKGLPVTKEDLEKVQGEWDQWQKRPR